MGDSTLGRTAMYWFVRRTNDNRLIGSASLVNLNYARKSIEWGYGIDPNLWGGGYILKIQELLKKYTFEILELNRLYGTTMVENHRTIASVLAAGMKHEGNLRDYYCKKGVFHDGWHYSMLRKEYFTVYGDHLSNGFEYSQGDVIDIVSSVLTEEEVNSETSISNSFGWDSYNHMLIMIAITEKTGITLSPAEVSSATSVAAIATLIAKASSRTSQ
jgi:acyl carrier protein